MQPRKCENCGLGMLPWVPRKRGPDGKLWCRNCHEGRPGRPRAQASRSGEVGAHPDALSPTTVEAVLAMEAESERLEAAEAILDAFNVEHQAVAEQYKPMVVEAHDSGDGQTIFHCPFCGGGQVIGRSDGTTECDFCHQAFTVQVQPQISSMPQTVNGQPMEMPGMPGGPPSPDAPFDQDTAGGAAQPPGAPQDAFVPPGDAPVPPGAPGGTSPPFQPPQKRAASLHTDAGRFPCPGSNVDPLPASEERGGLRTTHITPTYSMHHDASYGICPECQEAKPLLKSGKLPKHTRYLSWKQQGEMGLRPESSLRTEAKTATRKQSFFIGPEGVVMSERSYIHHLALRYADDRNAVLTEIRESNLA